MASQSEVAIVLSGLAKGIREGIQDRRQNRAIERGFELKESQAKFERDTTGTRLKLEERRVVAAEKRATQPSLEKQTFELKRREDIRRSLESTNNKLGNDIADLQIKISELGLTPEKIAKGSAGVIRRVEQRDIFQSEINRKSQERDGVGQRLDDLNRQFETRPVGAQLPPRKEAPGKEVKRPPAITPLQQNAFADVETLTSEQDLLNFGQQNLEMFRNNPALAREFAEKINERIKFLTQGQGPIGPNPFAPERTFSGEQSAEQERIAQEESQREQLEKEALLQRSRTAEVGFR